MVINQLQEPGSELIRIRQADVVTEYEARNALPVSIAATIPPEVQQVFEYFDDKEHPRADLADLRDILSIDEACARVHKGSDRYKAYRQEQADRLQPYLAFLGKAIIEDEFVLGWLIIEAEQRDLHEHCTDKSESVLEWCAKLGIRESLFTRAKRLYIIWPYWCNVLGFELKDLLNKDIYEVKAKFIQGKKDNMQVDIAKATIKVLEEKKPEVVPKNIAEISPRQLVQEVENIVRRLDPPLQQTINEKAIEDYTEEARRDVNNMRVIPDHAVLHEHEEKMGALQKPYILHTVKWEGGQLHYLSTRSPICELPQVMAMLKNLKEEKYRLVSIDGEPYEGTELLTWSELGFQLSLVLTPSNTTNRLNSHLVKFDEEAYDDEDEDDVEEDDDDDEDQGLY